MFLRAAETSTAGTVLLWLTSIVGLLTPILFALNLFGLGNFLSADIVELNVSVGSQPTNWAEIENALLQLNNQIATDRIILVLMLIMITVAFIVFSQKKLRGGGYRKASTHIHTFHHNIRDASILIDKVQKNPELYKQLQPQIKVFIEKSLDAMANNFKSITGAECSVTIKRLSFDQTETPSQGARVNGEVLTWMRDTATQADRSVIDKKIIQNNLGKIADNDHFHAMAITDNIYEVYIPDIKSDKRFEKMASFNAWKLANREPPYRAILMVGISAHNDPFDKTIGEGDAYHSIGILYVDCQKPYAFGYHCQELLHSFSDALYFVMKKNLHVYYLASKTNQSDDQHTDT